MEQKAEAVLKNCQQDLQNFFNDLAATEWQAGVQSGLHLTNDVECAAMDIDARVRVLEEALEAERQEMMKQDLRNELRRANAEAAKKKQPASANKPRPYWPRQRRWSQNATSECTPE